MTSPKGIKWGSKKQHPWMDIDRKEKPIMTQAIKKHDQALKLSGYLASDNINSFDTEWNKLYPDDPIKKPNRFMKLMERMGK